MILGVAETNRASRLGYPTGSPRLTVVAALSCTLLAVAFVLIRAVAPADGTQLVIDPGRPVEDGLVLRPDGGDARGFETGDLLVAIDGRSVNDILGATLGGEEPSRTAAGSEHV